MNKNSLAFIIIYLPAFVMDMLSAKETFGSLCCHPSSAMASMIPYIIIMIIFIIRTVMNLKIFYKQMKGDQL